MRSLRIVLIYQFFGPYHLDRWNCFRNAAEREGHTPLALQLFQKPDLYDWDTEGHPNNVVHLMCQTDGDDNLRWLDAPRLVGTLRAVQPDVVLVNGWGTRDAVVVHAWCRLHRLRRVLVSDSQMHDFHRSWLKERIKREIIRGVGSAFVAGTPQRRYAQELGVAPSAITYGCDVVNNDHFAPARALRRPGGYRLLTVARWSPEKNLLAAGRAFKIRVSATNISTLVLAACGVWKNVSRSAGNG